MKTYKVFSIILILTFFLSACDESFLDEVSDTFLSAENTLTTEEGLEAALIPLYRSVQEHIENKVFVQPGTDITKTTFNARSNNIALDKYNSELNGELSTVNGWWTDTYNAVAKANTIIYYLPDATFSSDQKRNQITGEAYFFRAIWYLDALQTWGDIPLILEPVDAPRTDFVRDPKDDVLAQVIADLEFAYPLLSPVPPEKGRITQGAAMHFLVNAYLVAEEWLLAENLAKELIDGSTHQLMTNRFGVQKDSAGTAYSDLFIDGNVNFEDGNKEVLWAFQYGTRETKDIVRTGTFKAGWWPVYEKIPGMKLSMDNYQRGKWRFCMTPYFFTLYETTDDRYSEFALRKDWYYNDASFIQQMKDAGTPLIQWSNGIPLFVNVGDKVMLDKDDPLYAYIYPTPLKFIDVMGIDVTESSVDKEYIYKRLAETYLFLAEAQFRQNKFSDAAETLNILRRRSHASDISAGDVTLDFILDERARELSQEVDRWATLVRTGKLVERVSAHNEGATGNIQAYHNLMPIPQKEIDRNPDSNNFKQNPGYPGSN